jgi:hypothetical protein
MILIQPSDFVGDFDVAKFPNRDTVLQAVIDKWERFYIMRILGVALGKLYIADLALPSQSPRFVVLTDAFDEQQVDDLCSKIYHSDGFKKTLLGMVYYQYVIDFQLKQTQSGVVKTQTDTAGVMGVRATARVAEKKFNLALESVDAIQWMCYYKEAATYPEFLGERIAPLYNSVL